MTYRIGQKFNSWNLVNFLKQGGNGEVWRAQDDNKTVAIKFLKKLNPTSYQRFCDEVKTVRKNSDIEGILPILDFYLPENPNGLIPWYVMPLATPILEASRDKTIYQIVELMISLSETLIRLHERKVSHRDIKPANILVYNDRPCLSDFGLVDYPDKRDITRKQESVGPKWTMAPEMRRNPTRANGIFADIYSFAKTMWILITRENKGFDGQYFPETIVDLDNYVPASRHVIPYLKPLGGLISESTDNDPRARPSAKVIQKRLSEWININRSHGKLNKLQWKDAQSKIFPFTKPSRAIWEDIDQIIRVLNLISRSDHLNHTFMPTGGGMNLLGAKRSYQDGCIELNFGYTEIVKPIRLVYESFNDKEDWNYFRLEADALKPSGYYKKMPELEVECLTELEPLVYTDALCSEFNDYNGQSLPSSARAIYRLVKGGSFVIFTDTSLYNRTGHTYDARHNKMTTDGFRGYISRTVDSIHKESPIAQQIASNVTIVRPTSHKVKRRLLKEDEIKLLEKVTKLSQRRTMEGHRLKQKYRPGKEISLADREFFEKPRPRARDLEDFLKALPQEQLVLVAAVMYGGRDSNPPWGVPLDELIEELREHEHLAESICEKAPLTKYLKRGIKLYS